MFANYAKFSEEKLFGKLDKLDCGELTIITPDGKSRTFAGKNVGEQATIELKSWQVIPDLIHKGDIGLAESYRDGEWETDNLTGLIMLGIMNRKSFEQIINVNFLFRMIARFSYMLRQNTKAGSRKNILQHYDLGNEFYKLWLDPSMTYSSALYKTGDESLEEAQYNKYDRILERLQGNSGRLLEIGCGWGGFADRAVDQGDFAIKGITLSDEQHDYANKRLDGRATIALEDYRAQTGQFDHIVSIEMFEAVGEKFWSTYFEKMAALLKKNGKALVQTITMNEYDFPRYRKGGDFIRSHIFPGGMLPSVSCFKAEVQKAGLHYDSDFFFGQDYARTLSEWLSTFEHKRNQILSMGFDDSFIRLWRFYLASCIAGFRTQHINVMQVELKHV